MKISEVIARIDALKPNKHTALNKLEWINQVDGMIWNELYRHTAYTDILRLNNVADYSLPVGIDFSLVVEVYVDGDPIFPITHKDFDTTGYYRGTDGKLNIYPVPTADDVTPGLRAVYKVPFVKHAEQSEDVYLPAPYDRAYDDYLAAMIDKYDENVEGYNNYMGFYNNSIKEYAMWYSGREG